EIAYLPGSSLPAGKLKWPLSFVTTVVVTVEPSFLALTSTPSIWPSSVEDTWPLSVCACAPESPAMASTLVGSNRDFNRMICLPLGPNLSRLPSGPPCSHDLRPHDRAAGHLSGPRGRRVVAPQVLPSSHSRSEWRGGVGGGGRAFCYDAEKVLNVCDSSHDVFDNNHERAAPPPLPPPPTPSP